MDPADGAFYDIILILQPRIECGQNTPNVVDGYLAGFPLHLVCGQILPNIIRGDPLHRFADRCGHGLDRFAIVGQCFFGATLDALGCNERCRCIRLFLLLLPIWYLSGNSGDVTIAGKSLGGGKLLVNTTEKAILSIVMMVLLPLGIIAGGVVVVRRRKRR